MHPTSFISIDLCYSMMPFRGPRECRSRRYLAARPLYISSCSYTAGNNQDLGKKNTVSSTSMSDGRSDRKTTLTEPKKWPLF